MIAYLPLFLQTYQQTLTDTISTLQSALERNVARQQKLTEEIEELQRSGSVAADERQREPSSAAKGSSFTNRKTLGVFMHPYFKDVNGYSAPANDDTREMRHVSSIAFF